MSWDNGKTILNDTTNKLIALEAEYKFIAQQVIEVSNGRVKISFLQAAAIDPTRHIRDGAEETEAALHLFVEGRPLQEHYHFNAWRRHASKVVSLSKSSQKRIGYSRSKITLSTLIAYIKNKPIN